MHILHPALGSHCIIKCNNIAMFCLMADCVVHDNLKNHSWFVYCHVDTGCIKNIIRYCWEWKLSLFQAFDCWGRAKASGRKNEGRLSRGMGWEPVRLSLMTLFWYSRSCYTLWLVDFDSTFNTPSALSFIVNQKDGERGLSWMIVAKTSPMFKHY